MTQEEKELLLKDLCSRLPNKTFAQWHHKALNKFRDVKIMAVSTYGENIDDYYINVLCQPEPGCDYEASIVDIKPYLRSMSSMTEEEGKELEHIFCEIDAPCWVDTKYGCVNFTGDNDFIDTVIAEVYTDWLNKKGFDYRGLIEKGLAHPALENMYNKTLSKESDEDIS